MSERRHAQCGGRLVDYYALIGLPEEGEVRYKAMTRRDSSLAIHSITDLVVSKTASVPKDFEPIKRTPAGTSANLWNRSMALMGKTSFLCVSRKKSKTHICELCVVSEKKPIRDGIGL
jgi:hypothetical protein